MNSNSSINTKPLWLLIILSLLGLAVSAYLSYEHYVVLQHGFAGKSFCNINSYFNCDLVLSSRYATIGTIPLAGVGLFFYLYLLGALLHGLVAVEKTPKILALPTLLVLVACIASGVLAYISFYKLGSFCLFCSSLYVINFLLFLGFAAFYRFKLAVFSESIELSQFVKSLLVIGVIFAIGLFLLHYQTKRSKQEIAPAELEKYLEFFFSQAPIELDTQNRPYWGNAESKVVLVEFSDFECPFCKLAAFNLKPMLTDYKNKIKLVYLHYPLDQSCNTHMPKSLHIHACKLSYATQCAAEQGKFWEYHDETFDLQPKFSESSYEEIAKKLGLNLDNFRACMQSPKTASLVASDIEQGQKVGLEGTPSIYLNGRKLEYWYIPQVLKKVIERSLEK